MKLYFSLLFSCHWKMPPSHDINMRTTDTRHPEVYCTVLHSTAPWTTLARKDIKDHVAPPHLLPPVHSAESSPAALKSRRQKSRLIPCFHIMKQQEIHLLSHRQFPLQKQTLMTCTFINCCHVDPRAFNTSKNQNKVQTRMITPTHVTAGCLSWKKANTQITLCPGSPSISKSRSRKT